MSEYWIDATGLPSSIMAGQTIRHPQGSACIGDYDFNLALHVGDAPAQVEQRRIELLSQLQPYGVNRLVWLEQTHSTKVHYVTHQAEYTAANADALVTREQGVACMIMTADCLPIVLSDATGQEVACIHAGWRGLLNGVIENTVQAMQSQPALAWLGAAIGPNAFEVGREVFEQFTAYDAVAAEAFVAKDNGKYMADIYLLAKQRLQKLGVTQVTGGDACTYQQTEQFFSYRLHPKTGRMATFVVIRQTA